MGEPIGVPPTEAMDDRGDCVNGPVGDGKLVPPAVMHGAVVVAFADEGIELGSTILRPPIPSAT